jgi:hypothetical protein
MFGVGYQVPKDHITFQKILKPVLSIITQCVHMPDVTSDERGRRIFQIHKEKAVETAVEKIRQSLGHEWTTFSQKDTKILTDILGEAWVSVERSVWEKSSFTRLTKKDVEEIIRIGNAVKNKTLREEAAINEICTILKRSS